MNKKDFSEKVLSLEDVLFHVSYGILQNVQDCEDVTQEAILKAYANLDKLKQSQFFKTYQNLSLGCRLQSYKHDSRFN